METTNASLTETVIHTILFSQAVLTSLDSQILLGSGKSVIDSKPFTPKIH